MYFMNKNDLESLLSLVSPISAISRDSKLISRLIEDGTIFYPVNITLSEAYEYLNECPLYEEKGIVCRIPQFWKRRNSRNGVSVNVGIKGRLGVDAVLSFSPELSYEEVMLAKEEVEDLLIQSEGLTKLKGKWVDIDKKKLQALLDTLSIFISDMTLSDVISYSVGLRKSPLPICFHSGDWLKNAFSSISESFAIPENLNAKLRGYQENGYRYLMTMRNLSLGMCLADDMGLGKTVQVIAYLLEMRKRGMARCLLIVPSSLIGNWEGELSRFAPSIDYQVYHGKDRTLPDVFLTITTYAIASRDAEVLSETVWDDVILDEAQNIKDAATKQTKAVKALARKHSLILAGTPIENNLMNLWSLMDFSNTGMLETVQRTLAMQQSSMSTICQHLRVR